MNTATGTSPDELRSRMVDAIGAETALSMNVATALRTVPRHQFLREASVEDAYADQAVTTKPGPERPLSCASQPTVVAQMLEQLMVRPGDHILEIGAGTGYNAALLTELVGPAGQVTTIEIYPDVADQARRGLSTADYGNVKVVCGDGADGHADRAPYDRIIVTVGPWDIPPAWTEQLAPQGRMVVPLNWRGQAQSIAFANHGTYLRSESTQLCGFIPMVGQSMERSGALDPAGDVLVYCDEDQDIEFERLRGVLAGPGTTKWSGVTIGANDTLDRLWLQLTAADATTCRIAAAQPAVESGLCRPAIPSRSPALVEGACIAYLHLRRVEALATSRWELGAVGHGPMGDKLAARLADHIRAWETDRTREPVFCAYPEVPNSAHPAGLVITRRHRRFILSL